jgi:hypothetical protein
METEKEVAIICDKDGTQMQEITTTEISIPSAPPPMRTYSCPKCGAIKMVPAVPFVSR